MKKVKIIKNTCAVGLGSTIMRGLHCLYYRPKNDLYYFDFYNSDYSDNNVWNTFFIQPFKEEIGCKPVSVEYINDIWKLGDFFLCYGNEQNTKFGKHQFETPERIEPLRQLWNEHIKIHNFILQPAKEYFKNFFQTKKILGVHKRGSDQFGPNGHAKGQEHLLDTNFYINLINKKLKEEHFDNIFLATDEEEMYISLRKQYGNKLLKQHTTLCPSHCNFGVHNIHKNSPEQKRNEIGYEVLRDMYLLSKCNFCFNVKSNVSLASIFMRSDYNYQFIDNHVDYGALG